MEFILDILISSGNSCATVTQTALMRITALLSAAGILAAGTATSIAQTVYSVNTVGVVSTIPSNGNYVCICNPLTNTSVANTLGNLIGTNLPVGGKVLKWNYAAVHFDIYTRVSF